MEPSNRICPKKRKIPHDPAEADDEEEIEEFFTLIRMMREARSRLSTCPPGVTEGGRSAVSKVPKLKETARPASGWKPAFELEDFLHDDPRAGTSAQIALKHDSEARRKAGSEDDRRDAEVSVDLTLSL